MADVQVVMAFGRFNPPSTGHARLIDYLRQEAKRRNAVPMVFASPRQDATNPLPFAEKVWWLKRFFPGVLVNENPEWRTPVDVLKGLAQIGVQHDQSPDTRKTVSVPSGKVKLGEDGEPVLKNGKPIPIMMTVPRSQRVGGIWIVVGSDQTANFHRLAKAVPDIKFDVLTVPDVRDTRSLGVAGMSSTKLRAAARAGNFSAFRKGTPTKVEREARKLYFTVRRHMGLTKGHAFLLCGLTLTTAKLLREAFTPLVPRVRVFNRAADALMEQSRPFFVDVSGHAEDVIRQLMTRLAEANYDTTIYMPEEPMPAMFTEGWLRQRSHAGMLRTWAQTVVTEDVDAAKAHAQRVLKVDAKGKSKAPTDVDRVKDRQGQELISLKQRQNDDLLQAKKQDLETKSRDAAEKITNKEKPGGNVPVGA
jgi:hypothetical protein